MLHQYLATARDVLSPHFGVGAIPELFQNKHRYTESNFEMLKEIAKHDKEQYELRRAHLITSFALGESSSNSELDLHILNAIISDTTDYKPSARLNF